MLFKEMLKKMKDFLKWYAENSANNNFNIPSGMIPYNFSK